MGEWPKDVIWVAEVMPDWTTLQLKNGDAFAFNREDGRVYKIPDPACPFVIFGETEAERGCG